jgi:hypothetical protein
MTDKEALRVALACTIDTHRNLPLARRERVRQAALILVEIVEGKRAVNIPQEPEPVSARDIVLGKAGADVH